MVSESVAQGASLPRGVGACIHTLPRVGRQFDHLAAPVLGRGGCPCVWTVRSQGSAVPTRGTFVVRDNRLANSVQTHLFRYRQCGSCRQARALDPALLRLARRGGGGRWRTLRATDALEGAASRVVRSGAQGKRPTRGGRKCENALELRGRASAEFSRTGDARGSFEQQVPVKSVFAQTR